MSDTRASPWYEELEACVNMMEQMKGTKIVQGCYLVPINLVEQTCLCMWNVLNHVPPASEPAQV